jgi:hypothetical protein
MDESGAHHLACVAANALMALDAILNKTINDDRNKAYGEKNMDMGSGNIRFVYSYIPR